MRIEFSKVGGWNGGVWKFNGMTRVAFQKLYKIDPLPVKGMQAEIEGPFGVLPCVTASDTVRVEGSDHDHGHLYRWNYDDPAFYIGTCPVPVQADAIWKQGYRIYLEVS